VCVVCREGRERKRKGEKEGEEVTTLKPTEE
jgi:hypothetical protein